MGKGPLVIRDHEGVIRTGGVVDIHDSPTKVKGGQLCGLVPWLGEELCVLRAWLPEGTQRMSSACRRDLSDLGFKILGGPVDGYEMGLQPVGKPRSFTSGKDRGMSPPPERPKEWTCSVQVADAPEELESWEVEFPLQLVDDSWVHGALALSEAAAHACTVSVRQICRTETEPEISGNLEGVVRALQERGWIEEVLSRLQDPSEHAVALRSLAVDVPLRESVPTAPEQFLQTRTVSLEEARRELGMWYDAGKEEVEALEITTGAVDRIEAGVVDKWISEGKRVVQVPGKAVLTRKSGVGKRRLRAVCCGNHMPASATGNDKADLYAGGVDALTVRVVLGYSAQFEDWTVCVLDIKTAFLNAPARSSAEGDESGPIIVVKPPYFLIQLGLIEAGQRWRVRRALYGLQTSPKDWAVYRDSEMRSMVVHTKEPSTLTQSQTDDSMWLVRTKKGVILGVVIVYVDDIAVFGPGEVTRCVSDAFMAKWKTSTPTWPSLTEPVSFCGMEIARTPEGWRITQCKYLQEILRRYEIEGVTSCPMTRWEEPEMEQASVEQVKGSPSHYRSHVVGGD